MWDYMTHANPNLISDQTNGDISSDFYHMYAQDIQLASNIGVSRYNNVVNNIKLIYNTNLCVTDIS